MSGNEALNLVQERGWRRGLNNMLRAEFGKWWGTRQWWIQSLIWIGVINGILAGVLWSSGEVNFIEGIDLYSVFSGLFPAVAVVIILQDALVGEKESGTAAWVLSKPVSRVSFVISKLFANTLGVLVTMILLPGLIAFLQISLASGGLLPPLHFLAGQAVLGINLLLYLSLTLMLGTFFSHRGPVIGIPLALVFGQQMLLNIPGAIYVLPWSLAVPVDDSAGSIASALMRGNSPALWSPLYAALILIVVFAFVGLWRFEKEEL
jgi:ABC-2 type transport system permease protein